MRTDLRCGARRLLTHRSLTLMDEELIQAIDRVLSLSGGDPVKGKLTASVTLLKLKPPQRPPL